MLDRVTVVVRNAPSQLVVVGVGAHDRTVLSVAVVLVLQIVIGDQDLGLGRFGPPRHRNRLEVLVGAKSDVVFCGELEVICDLRLQILQNVRGTYKLACFRENVYALVYLSVYRSSTFDSPPDPKPISFPACIIPCRILVVNYRTYPAV